MAEVKQWMVHNKLKLNDDKTEFIVIGTRQQRSKIDISHITSMESALHPLVLNLGVMFDSEMSMKDHVSSINHQVT